MKLEVKKIGNSTGLILPKELLSRLNLAQGDWLSLTEGGDGSVRLSPLDPTFEKGMEIAEKAMKTYRNALSELAK
ncbi:AbrB family transcriptional regulator [Methylobacterium sp. Leaf469]|jgi:putative addiction module antidote|uniref:AbrB/MazE/SpoVT family DNA-binding domain-containing protein n=1 Tax=unclassified Methylobacterium TaxID=2615210 RepID=UPI000700AAC8|nr:MULTISPECIES: AbrB/MazE/SpoVT family DNA-binding domain-containing protein [unclassified Methylobacterium]USU31322.1 AbrB family transcriptional regulator [Methylobacterium sp. OTU13CASTA1]KQO56612.1 AbrB family transcriptional regulator [Methylobacterium sp. Leaf87]KQP18595.1 AbrB family transcriptional regulator [Methylobacterium sp. Leaf100]KQP23936.1 AbrB family transcriptional regulator [Methylobacterium sp. Leaf102]KQP68072.1 AbrB family transcriptional regulator [Methylobacterium sp.